MRKMQILQHTSTTSMYIPQVEIDVHGWSHINRWEFDLCFKAMGFAPGYFAVLLILIVLHACTCPWQQWRNKNRELLKQTDRIWYSWQSWQTIAVAIIFVSQEKESNFNKWNTIKPYIHHNLIDRKKIVSQNCKIPIINGICSYCVYDR